MTSTFRITFDEEFSEFEHQLAHLAKLMIDRVGALTMQMTLDSSRTITNTSKLHALGREFESKRAELLKDLCPFHDRFDQRQRHEQKKEAVNWIFENEHYIKWKECPGSSACILSGKIGSGRAVMAAKIVSSLKAFTSSDSSVVAGFMCRANDPSSPKYETIMGSITYQLVRSLGRQAEDAVNKYLDNTLGHLIDMTLKALF